MKDDRINLRVGTLLRRQITELCSTLDLSITDVISLAVERLHQQELSTMKVIKVGKTNDLHLYAVKARGRYFPLSESDLEQESPDAKIYYDSGIYPGITLEQLPQYICDKAK